MSSEQVGFVRWAKDGEMGLKFIVEEKHIQWYKNRLPMSMQELHHMKFDIDLDKFHFYKCYVAEIRPYKWVDPVTTSTSWVGSLPPADTIKVHEGYEVLVSYAHAELQPKYQVQYGAKVPVFKI